MFFFFFNDTATTEIYTLSLHDALPISFLPSVPQEFVEVDRDKVLKQGVPLNDVYRTIQAFMGGYFINYFNRFGRQWQVYIEAESEDRAKAENVGQLYGRNSKGEDVPR